MSHSPNRSILDIMNSPTVSDTFMPVASTFDGVNADGSDISTALKATHDAVKASGHKAAYFPPGAYAAPNAYNQGNVTYVGEGTLSSNRKYIIPMTAGHYVPNFAGDLVPERHLRRLLSCGPTCSVVITGDSTSTEYGGNSITPLDPFYGQIRARLRRDYPEKTFTFTNTSITGGSWDTVQAAQLAAVTAANPDVVFIMLGTNNPGGMRKSYIDAYVAAIDALPNGPDVILCTCYQRSSMADVGTDPVYGMLVNQDNRENTAGISRTWAKRNDRGLLDFNRMSILARDGFDICNFAHKRRDDLAGTIISMPDPVASNQWTSPVKAHGHDITLSFDNTSGDFIRGTNTLRFGLSLDPTNYFTLTGNGTNIVMSLRDDPAGGTQFTSVDTGVPVPTGVATLRYITRGEQLLVYLGTTPIFEGTTVRGASWYYPYILASQSVGGKPITITKYVHTTHLLYMPQGTDTDFWGDIADDIYGGNAINHPTSLQLNRIVGAVLDSVHLKSTAINEKIVQSVAASTTIRSDATLVKLTGSTKSRHNLYLQSETLTNASNVKTNATAADAATTVGGVSYSGLTEATDTAQQHQVSQAFTKAASTLPYTFDFEAVADTCTKIRVYLAGASVSNSVQAQFDLSAGTTTGVVNSGTFTGGSSSITSLGNGRYRCSITCTSNTETALNARVFMADASALTTYNGTGRRVFLTRMHLWDPTADSANYTATTTTAVTAADDYALTLPAPATTRRPQPLLIEMVGITGTNGVTIDLTNAVGGSASSSARFSAVGHMLAAIPSNGAWLIIKEKGVTLT